MSSGSRLNILSGNRPKLNQAPSTAEAGKHRSRLVVGSNSRNSATTHAQPDDRRVINAEGLDVTPRPLLRARDDGPPRPESAGGGTSFSQTGDLRATGGGRQQSRVRPQLPTQIVIGEGDDVKGGTFRESTGFKETLSGSLNGSMGGSTMNESTSRTSGLRKFASSNAGRAPPASGVLSPSHRNQQAEETVIESLVLKETMTFMTLTLRGAAVAMDCREKGRVEGRNAHYSELLETKQYKDRFTENHAQTATCLVKHKQAQAVLASTREVGCTATAFEIHDATRCEVQDEDELGRNVAPPPTLKSTDMAARVEEMVRLSLVSRGCLLGVEEGLTRQQRQALPHASRSRHSTAEVEEDAKVLIDRQKAEKIMKSSQLARSLCLAEMAVQQNLHFKAHAKYRNLPTTCEVDEWWAPRPVADNNTQHKGLGLRNITPFVGRKDPPSVRASLEAPEASSAADTVVTSGSSVDGSHVGEEGVVGGGKRALEKLWDYSAHPLTLNREVTCMAWSTARAPTKASLMQVAEDLLMVGYSVDSTELCAMGRGLVLLWSLRSCEYPERIIRPPTGVTALAPSRSHPNLVAVGMADGVVAIYDTLREEDFDTPLLESSGLPDSSYDPIWQLRWVERQDKSERLVSVCNDGRVMEWDLKKGLNCQLLMTLKRSGDSTGLLSSYAFGLCLAFLPSDPSLYLAGTEDGLVLKCSCSYKEQSLDSMTAHHGPVYALGFSPFHPQIFLTAGGDWSVRIWEEGQSKPLHTIQTSVLTQTVTDAAWSPLYETVLGAVTGDGKVVLWDLAKSLMDPVVCSMHDKNIHTINSMSDTQAAANLKHDPVARRNSLLKSAMAAQKKNNPSDHENDMGRANSVAKGQGGSDDSTSRGGTDKKGSTTRGGNSTPLIQAKQLVSLTCMAFSETGPILATGTSSGLVEIYRMVGFDQDPPEQQMEGEEEIMHEPEATGGRLRSLFKAESEEPLRCLVATLRRFWLVYIESSPWQSRQELLLHSEVGVMNAEERFYAEILSGNLSFVLALLGVAILYANAYLFQDYLGEVVTAYVLAQALKKGREVVLYLLTRLDKDGHAKEPLVDKMERMLGEFVTHLMESNPVDTIKNYSLLLLPILGMLLLLARLLGFIPFLAVMVLVSVAVHLMLARLDRKLFNYRKYLKDESMASLLTMLTCLIALGSLGVFLVGGSALECVEAGRRTSAFMQTSVLSDANKQQVMTFVDQGTQQVMDRITPYLENASIALDENRVKFDGEWWWPTVDRVATGLLEGTKAAAAGNDTDAHALYQVVVGSFGSVNVTEFMASVNTTAITELLDVGALAGKAAGAGVSLLDFALKLVSSLTSLLALVVGFLLSVLGLVSFLGSLFWFLDHPRLLTTLLDDMVPISPKTQQLITHTIQEAIERVLLLPLKLASSHGIITLLTFSTLCVDFPFLATALSILLTMVPLLPPKLVCLPWTFALVLSYRTFVPILPGLDFIWVPAPLKGVLLLGIHATVMTKVDERLFALPHDTHAQRPQAFVTSLAFILGYQRFGTAGVLVGPGILCLGELFYGLIKGLKASVMAQDAASIQAEAVKHVKLAVPPSRLQ